MQPNILLITSDQQHYSTLGCDNPHIRTPALDRLAREGMKFNRAYCPNPTCTPTRGSLLTGMWPSAHGGWTLGTKIPEKVPTIGEILRQKGYATSLIGKAHFHPLASREDSESWECQPVLRDLDFWRSFNDKHTPWYGFDRVELARNHADESHVGQHYALWMQGKGFTNWKEYFQPLPGETSRYAARSSSAIAGGRSNMSWQLPHEFHYTTWTGERTKTEILRATRTGQPFFCWSSYHDPHPPYIVSEPWASMYDPADMPIGRHTPGEFAHMPPHHQLTQQKHPDFDAAFNGSCDRVHGFHSHLHDEQTLRKAMAVYYGMISFMDSQIGLTLSMLDELGIINNTLIVFTTDHGHFLGQHGLAAKGPFHYEDLLRVPMLTRWPGHIAAGSQTNAIQSLVDFAPTFCHAAGVEVPVWMQGINQLDTWSGGKPVRNWTIIENNHEKNLVQLRTYINERYKLTLYRQESWGELFDLQEDPDEKENLYSNPACLNIRRQLIEEMLRAEINREHTLMPRIAVA